MIKQKIFLIGGGIALVVIVVVAVMIFKGFNFGGLNTLTQEVSTAEPVDIAMDFYIPWLDAVQSTSTTPYASQLASKTILSEALRTRLINSEGRTETEVDPVLCQITIPERVTGRIVSQDTESVRVLIVAKDKTMPAQSIFTLKRANDGWYIDDISCSGGEFDVPREFSYEKEGFLLKDVPPPYDPNNWHIVFEENGQMGYVTPLFFSETSKCYSPEVSEEICVPDAFTQARKIRVQGQMSERGVEVMHLQFTEPKP
jgi:hypothetical protein